MNCCIAQEQRRPKRSRWRGLSGCAGSGALLVLLPKCPMCIAAYLALWTGAGVAMPIATHLRMALAVVFVGSITILLVRRMTMRAHSRS